jgi:hypothetical protein
MSNPNLDILELVAHALGPVCDEVVFVGGCAAGLLLTQARPDRIRVTEDVDIVAQALTIHDYHAVEKRVRAQGFSNDIRPGAPICRWVYKNVTLDVMPTVKEILGFANRWYPLVPAGHCHGAVDVAALGPADQADCRPGVHRHQARSVQRPWPRCRWPA